MTLCALDNIHLFGFATLAALASLGGAALTAPALAALALGP